MHSNLEINDFRGVSVHLRCLHTHTHTILSHQSEALMIIVLTVCGKNVQQEEEKVETKKKKKKQTNLPYDSVFESDQIRHQMH